MLGNAWWFSTYQQLDHKGLVLFSCVSSDLHCPIAFVPLVSGGLPFLLASRDRVLVPWCADQFYGHLDFQLRLYSITGITSRTWLKP